MEGTGNDGGIEFHPNPETHDPDQVEEVVATPADGAVGEEPEFIGDKEVTGGIEVEHLNKLTPEQIEAFRKQGMEINQGKREDGNGMPEQEAA